MPAELTVVKAEHWHPHDYQKKAVTFLLEHAAAGLLLDPGLGKTSVCLGAIKLLKREKLLDRVLIIAPLRVCYNVWPAEVQKWADFNHLRVELLHGAGKDKAVQRDADIYVINPEGLDWLMMGGRMKTLSPDTLIIDESSRFRHTNTRRFKNIKPYLPRFKRRWILTGTPAPNGLLDLFGQIYILDLGRALSPYITHFRTEFFNPTGFGGYTWVPKAGSAERIQEILKPLTLRLSAEDYLELPKLVHNTITVELPPTARRIYDELEEHLITQLEGTDEVVTAMSVAAASMKCRQVANGGLYRQLTDGPLFDSDRWTHIHNAKTDAAVDLIDELEGQQVLIAHDFKHDIDRLRKALPNAVFAGDYSPKKFKEIEDAWNNGEIQLLGANAQSIGHGMNLQRSSAQHVLWYSLTWDAENYEQFILRVKRQGNKASHVFNHHIVAKDTVDEAIMKALAAKVKNQNTLLSALKDYSKRRKMH